MTQHPSLLSREELEQLVSDLQMENSQLRGNTDETLDSLLRVAFASLGDEARQMVAKNSGALRRQGGPASFDDGDASEDRGGLLMDTFDDEELYGEREPIIDSQTGFQD